jgi:hypothetical protein
VVCEDCRITFWGRVHFNRGDYVIHVDEDYVINILKGKEHYFVLFLKELNITINK